MKVTATIPTMLAELVKGDRTIELQGTTVGGVLDALFAVHPELRVHVLDESGSIRPHVSCFRNDRMVDDLEEPVTDGDSVLVLQAVSGGAPTPDPPPRV
jgi:molybdopterin synthase sulfur carrier subunit